jgi:hypothetical protein
MNSMPSSQHGPNSTTFQLLWWRNLHWYRWAVCVGLS